MTTPSPPDEPNAHSAPQPPDQKITRAALDEAIRAHAADMLDPDEVIVSWITAVATRNATGGGYVITLQHELMPPWEREGILRRALLHTDDEDRES